MAMEKQYVVRDTHTRSITALGYNPIRREIMLGFEGIVLNRPTPTTIVTVDYILFLSLVPVSEIIDHDEVRGIR